MTDLHNQVGSKSTTTPHHKGVRMSTTFQETAKALQDNPELKAKVMSAESAEDRASILREAGVTVPTHADVNAHQNTLEGVDGGGNTTTQVAHATQAAAAGAAA